MTRFEKFIETKSKHGVDVGFETGFERYERVKLHPEDAIPKGLNQETLRKFKPLSRQQLKSMDQQRKEDKKS